jgi:hypothetical protein
MYSNVFVLLLFMLFIFKYFIQSHHIFTDTISNIPLTLAVVFSVFLRPDEQLQDLSVCSLLQGSYIRLTTNKSPN